MEVGEAQAGLGYTGEWWDADAELLYLRARWYQPEVGRFASPDRHLGNVHVPLDLHRYIYVRNNPVLFTDPSGLAPLIPPFPPDHRDLTSWLVREVGANANGPEVGMIRTYNKLADSYYGQGEQYRSSAALLFGIAAYEWRELVKDGARWDFKDQIKDKLEGETVMLCHSGGCEWFEYSVPGNIHYGYVARAAGFSLETLHLGASVAEIMDPAHREEARIIGKYFVNVHVPLPCLIEQLDMYVNFEWWRAGFDDPTDYAAVELGGRLFDRARYDVRMGDFKALLRAYASRLMHMPAPTEPYFNPAWPYPLGYFDGGGG